MEKFVLFCFKPCLKGENNKEYYTVLEVSSKATQDEIKKAFKKKSLALHPDKLAQRGIEATAEDKQLFLKMKEAYDVLSDQKRKGIYDEYGPSGLKLVENPAELNPLDLMKELLTNFQRNRADRCSVALLLVLFFCSLLILPILFCLKCDGTLGREAPWLAIWTPMWIVNGFLLLGSLVVLCDAEETMEDEEGNPIPVEKMSLSEKLISLTKTVLFILIQIFVFMRLDEVTKWSWFEVFIPWFIYEAITSLELVYPSFLLSIHPPAHDDLLNNVEEGQDEELLMNRLKSDAEYFMKVVEQKNNQKSFFISVLRAWLAVFLALEVDGTVDWDWGLVLLPIWLYLFLQYATVCYFSRWASYKLRDIDPEIDPTTMDYDTQLKVQQSRELGAQANASCFLQCTPLFMAILLVSRLESSVFSTFLIILPVFIGLGCCCCVVFCGFMCLSNIDLDELSQQMEKEMSPQGQQGDEENPSYVPPTEPTIIIGSFETEGAVNTDRNDNKQDDIKNSTDRNVQRSNEDAKSDSPLVSNAVSETGINVDID